MFNVDNDLDMPRDVIHGECLCQIIGRNEIVIENYKCIKSITDTDIEIVCKKYKIIINGTGLNIKYYNNQSMAIGGYICEISLFLQQLSNLYICLLLILIL